MRGLGGGELLESRELMTGLPMITEFVSSNDRGLRDGRDEASDWVELYNAGDEAIDLTGWHLTDQRTRLEKWTFPSLRLDPAAYTVVFASGATADQSPDLAGYLHASFRLAADGEYLALVDPQGVVRQEFAPRYPQQWTDISFGLAMSTNGEGLVTVDVARSGYFGQPTPAAPNGLPYAGVTQDTVTFSRASGTFATSFALEMSASHAAASIYYTLNGTVPDENSLRYDRPLTLSGSTQIRARVIEPDRVPGPIRGENYVRLTTDLKDFRSELPILIIDNFNHGSIPNSGWNQTNSGIRQVPRQSAAWMLFEPQGAEASLRELPDMESRVGIRVRGAYSSSFTEPGYSVEMWDDDVDADTDRALLGMAADADWVLYAPHPAYDEALIDNTFLFELTRQMGHWAPQAHYVETFVNTRGSVSMADYVGLYVIMEKVKRAPGRLDFDPLATDGSTGGWLLEINRMDSVSEDGIAPRNFHTAGPDGILQTPRDLSQGSGRGDDIPRQYNAYINFDDPRGYTITQPQRDAIEGWLKRMEDVLYGRDPSIAWNDPEQGYARYIDTRSFIDYFILNNLSMNGDGLLLSMWLYNPDPGGGGRLTFGPMWDVDLGSHSGATNVELFRRAEQLWFPRLFRDAQFRQQYIDRWHELRQTVLSDTNMGAVIENLRDSIGTAAASRDGVTNWTARLTQMGNWLASRAAAIDSQFLAPPVLEPSGGVVACGTAVRLWGSQGEIYYTTDGSDPRSSDGSVSPAAQRVELASTVLLPETATAQALIPTADLAGQIGDRWRDPTFVPGSAGETWIVGPAGLGFDRSSKYTALIQTDLKDVDASVWIRLEFDLPRLLSPWEALELQIQYDDGFVAYLNGQEVARANAPGAAGSPLAFDAIATLSHQASPETWDRFDLSPYRTLLREGTNVLAIQGMNISRQNTDLLIRPRLLTRTGSDMLRVEHHLEVAARQLLGTTWSSLARAVFDVRQTGGDFNRDGVLSAVDIDLLFGEMRRGGQSPWFDVDASGKVDEKDRDRLIHDLLGTSYGDTNLDRRFDSSDLLSAFQAGVYESPVVVDVGWLDGDWDGDGSFTSSDIVLAFQSGGYVSDVASSRAMIVK